MGGHLGGLSFCALHAATRAIGLQVGNEGFPCHQADITGRDTYLLVEALTFAVEALSGLPIEFRPDNNIADMKRLVEEFVKHDAGLAHSQMIARRRLGYVLAYGKTNGT